MNNNNIDNNNIDDNNIDDNNILIIINVKNMFQSVLAG